jgi:hypothetical protein
MPIATQATTLPDGSVHRVQELITTSAAAATAITLTYGFVPKRVLVHNVTDRISDEFFEGMAAASSIHSVAVGTRTLETTNGVTVDTDLRTVTLTAVTMAASKTFAILVEG